VNSQRILLDLARKGMDRQAAYVVVQRNAMRVHEEGVEFKDALLADAELLKVLRKEEIEACFSVDYHLRNIDEIFTRVFGA
jgi:adenylosuccinate lyase